MRNIGRFRTVGFTVPALFYDQSNFKNWPVQFKSNFIPPIKKPKVYTVPRVLESKNKKGTA